MYFNYMEDYRGLFSQMVEELRLKQGSVSNVAITHSRKLL